MRHCNCLAGRIMRKAKLLFLKGDAVKLAAGSRDSFKVTSLGDLIGSCIAGIIFQVG